jgi:hypothetical protein
VCDVAIQSRVKIECVAVGNEAVFWIHLLHGEYEGVGVYYCGHCGHNPVLKLLLSFKASPTNPQGFNGTYIATY